MIINSITLGLQNFSKVLLRSPRAGEGDILLNYFKKIFHESSQNFIFPSNHYDNKSSLHQEAFIKKFTEDQHSFAIFVYVDNTVVGHIVMHNFGYERAWHRASLMMGVLNDWQNKGIGKALLKNAIAEAFNLGIFSIELRVREFNAKAISLYLNQGFKITGEIKGAANIDGEFVDEYLLIRDEPTFLRQLKPFIKLDIPDKNSIYIEALKNRVSFLEKEVAASNREIEIIRTKLETIKDK